MRQRWFSARALKLHLAVVLWVPACLVAAWWQVNRAFDGNGLSYLYSVEWPLFALVGVWAWWQLLHLDPASVGRRAQQQLAHTETVPDAPAAEAGASASAPQPPARRHEDEDAELAAYNDRLAALAAQGPKTWRRR